MNVPCILIDVMNVTYRSYFAYHGFSYEGKPTAVYYGMLEALLGLKKQFNTNLIAFCWDYGLPGVGFKPNWRKEIFPEYKSKRAEKEKEIQDMLATLPELYRTLEGMGWKNLGVPGLEADDIIGLVTNSKEDFLIFSTDKDLYQLLDGDRVRIIAPKKQASVYQLITKVSVEREFGIPVSQWSKYLALGGDTSDDIHVLPKVGAKKGIKLLLDGANPAINWLNHSAEFQAKYIDYKSYWPKVMAAYKVADIPRITQDLRISKYMKGADLELAFASIPDKDEVLRVITGFCADNGLAEHLSKRFDFL